MARSFYYVERRDDDVNPHIVVCTDRMDLKIRRQTKITTNTLEQVCEHFEKTKIGWVNEWPVLQGKFKNFPQKFNHLLGGSAGPTNNSKKP